jgi:hypothetical protein
MFSFIGTLSQLQPDIQNEIVQLTIKAATTVAADDTTINSPSHQFNNLLPFTQSEYVDSISLGLIAAFLSYETWTHLKLWWDDEIWGEQCAKKIKFGRSGKWNWWRIPWIDDWQVHCNHNWTGNGYNVIAPGFVELSSVNSNWCSRWRSSWSDGGKQVLRLGLSNVDHVVLRPAITKKLINEQSKDMESS